IDSMFRVEDSLTNLQNMDKDDPFYNAIMEETLKQMISVLNGTDQQEADYQRLVAGANELRDTLEEGSEFNAGLNSLDEEFCVLEAGANQLEAGASELEAGSKKLKSGTNELDNGAQEVANGTQTVRSGWTELQENVAELHNGTKQVADGNQTVKQGWS